MANETDLLKENGDKIFDVVSPIYLLDSNYCFLDWNLTFGSLLAEPFSLAKGQHVGNFVNVFKNSKEVYERSAKVFGVGNTPTFDTEVISIEIPNIGLTHFQKLATQICDDKGEQQIWVIQLNICTSENIDQLWAVLEKVITGKA